ncbi:MAG: epimerase, partial [Chloroflexota bacterium]|nr:epimerase [Chloroflexota bacterium]
AQANYRAAMAPNVSGAFNVGAGSRISINDLARLMYNALGREPDIEYGPPRPGDVRDSLADTSAAERAFAYRPTVKLEAGMAEYLEWASRALVAR